METIKYFGKRKNKTRRYYLIDKKLGKKLGKKSFRIDELIVLSKKEGRVLEEVINPDFEIK